MVLLLSVSGGLAWQALETKKLGYKLLFLFLFQFALIALRPTFLIAFGKAFPALLCTVLAIAIAIYCIYSFFRISKWAAIVLIPYLVYISYLAVLNFLFLFGPPGVLPNPQDDLPLESATEPTVEVLDSVLIKGQTYPVISINGVVWMAANLNYDPGTGGGLCYENDTLNCQTYGRLYTWDDAQKACAELGWRLPTKPEWDDLRSSYDNDNFAYDGLIQGGKTGFNAVLGGSFNAQTGTFEELGQLGNYWSATEYKQGDGYIWKYAFRSNRGFVSRDLYPKEGGCSCRCVK